MLDKTPVKAPGGFAPAFALGQADAAGNLVLISADNPLPVASASGPTVTPPPPALEGETSQSLLAGPFDPAPGRPIYLQLDGQWTGTVRLSRSVDGGASRHPLTLAGAEWGVFVGNACEPVWEEYEAGAALYLDISLDSGLLAYRVSQ